MSDLSDDLLTEGSSSEDDLEFLLGVPKQKNENYIEEVIPAYDDSTYFEHFRMSRDITLDISHRFERSNYYHDQNGHYGKISALNHIFIFLWFIGHQTSSLRDVADRFNVSISSLHRVIRRVSLFLSNLSPEMIIWPSKEEKKEIEAAFRSNGFPSIIGAIDGCHIKIDKPAVDPDSYINRKGYYSIHMQVVCDNKLKIRDVFIGYPGSVHDSRVFRNSPLAHTLADKCDHYFLLGDSGYPLCPNLLTPYPDRGMLTREQIHYNVQLAKNRYVIEHCFGILKQKFRQLYHLKIRDIETCAHLIRAACVLHNICISDGLPLQNIVVDPPAPPQNDDDFNDESNSNIRGIRDQVARSLP